MDDFFNEMSEEEIDMNCRYIARAIAKAKNVVILTGAGISVSAGIPDFRSHDGLWTKYNPNVYANYSTFISRPEMFWKMSSELRRKMGDKKPTKAHFALTELQKMGKLQTLITQNIDNLHQLSGSVNVIELHGTGKICHCIECDYSGNVDILLPEGLIPWIDIPRCPKCGNLVKLDVVLFGEKLQNENFEKAFEAAANADVFLVIGSSLEVMPANALPKKAKTNFATVGIINKSSTRYDDTSDYLIRGDAEDVVPKIVEYVNEYMHLSCMQKIIDSFKFPIQVIQNPMESLTQLVAGVIKWIGPKPHTEEIVNCLVASEEIIEPIITRSPHVPVNDHENNEEENNKADKVMNEIHSSIMRRRHTFGNDDNNNNDKCKTSSSDNDDSNSESDKDNDINERNEDKKDK